MLATKIMVDLRGLPFLLKPDNEWLSEEQVCVLGLAFRFEGSPIKEDEPLIG